MDRSILFLMLSLVCFYLILDEFVGKKRISTILEGSGISGTVETPAPAPEPFDPDKAVPDAGGITRTDQKEVPPIPKKNVLPIPKRGFGHERTIRKCGVYYCFSNGCLIVSSLFR